DSCGRTGLGRPRRRLSAEEAPRNAHGKRSTWSGNQQAPNFFLCFFNQVIKEYQEKYPSLNKLRTIAGSFFISKSIDNFPMKL
ncbi:MAG TPA: hypothetical protein VJ558_06630, partial [Bacillales bacterium]|nr:hypothetical protein [Bacillales bacterium]